jgi:predicted O-methyltransferase YrrM
MKLFRKIYKYILHLLLARNSYGFGVHSPFIYNFTQFVLCEKCSFYIFPVIENLRKNLKNDSRVLNIKDFGTAFDRKRTIANIAKHALKSKNQGQLLFRIAHYIKAHNVLEFGTSLGITTSYLASSSSKIKCVSLEGCPETAQIANQNFEKLGIKNVELIIGSIDETLDTALNKFEKLDLVFIDANHKSEAVLRYFELCLSKIKNDSILILDDIYWSADMEMAWQTIKNHSLVTSTIDIFEMGIVFFNTDLNKTHYKMRY